MAFNKKIFFSIKKKFGFVTGCHPGDKFMVQATLSSIRKYCQQVPICLIADRGVDVSDLQSEYNIKVIHTNNLKNKKMKELCYGSFMAKMVPMWMGPFEFYVWLDSDAVLWGDISEMVNPRMDFQIFWDQRHFTKNEKTVPAWVKHFYFDPKNVRKYNSSYDWHNQVFFSTGVYGCKKNFIPFEKWMDIVSWDQKRGKQTFKFGDMGLLTYFVHIGERMRKKICMTDLQQIPYHHGSNEIVQDCLGYGFEFPEKVKRPRILHFCGRKPLLFAKSGFIRPFTIARLAHYRRNRGRIMSWLAVIREEIQILFYKILKKLKKLVCFS